MRWCSSAVTLNFAIFSPDVRTQAMFQLLDPGFVGLIFSCFSEDAQKVKKAHTL
jgi:hypothetical protein